MVTVETRNIEWIDPPEELRQLLRLKAGEKLKVERVEGGFRILPSPGIDPEAARRRALDILTPHPDQKPLTKDAEDKLMQEVVNEIKAYRREQGQKRH
jgi:bifunctional DNA-binding transcriptional regulator/antitoxin component of YhaV-PrlF toxin-antitoxin module